MTLLDPRTVLISYVISSLISVVVMASLWVQHRQRLPEPGYGRMDFVMQFVGRLLIVLRGFYGKPDLLSIVLNRADATVDLEKLRHIQPLKPASQDGNE